MNDGRYDTVAPIRYVEDGELWSLWRGKGRFYVTSKPIATPRMTDKKGRPHDIPAFEPWQMQFVGTEPKTAYNPILGLRYKLWLQSSPQYVFAMNAKAEAKEVDDTLVYSDRDLENWLVRNGMHPGDLATSTKGWRANIIHVILTIITLFTLMAIAVMSAVIWLVSGSRGLNKLTQLTSANAKTREYRTWGGEF